MKVRVAFVALAIVGTTCTATKASAPTPSPHPPPSLDPPAVSIDKLFSRDGVEFRYPANWPLEITAQGAGVAIGCSDGFWAATALLPAGGAAGVTQCPSSYDWPPEGYSAGKALRLELMNRSGNDIAAVRSLDPGEMGGLQGIRAETALDATAAAHFGISGPSRGLIYRTSGTSSDPNRPNIYELFCEAPVNDDQSVLESCTAVAASFHARSNAAP